MRTLISKREVLRRVPFIEVAVGEANIGRVMLGVLHVQYPPRQTWIRRRPRCSGGWTVEFVKETLYIGIS